MNTITPSYSFINSKDNFELSNYTKSIRLTLNGFTFSVYNDESHDLYLLNHYDLPSSINNKDIIHLIADVNNSLGISCKKNLFYYYTHTNTQIPTDYFEKESENDILTLLTPESNSSTILSERIDLYEFYNLSVWDKTFLSAIRETFPDFTIKSILSNLFKLLHVSNESEKKVLLFIENMHFTILAAEKKQFLGANGFSFTNESDFIYYAVNFIRKLFVQTNDIQIVFGGNIEERSPIFQSVRKYFKQTSILQNTHSYAIENNHYFCDLF